MSDRDRINSPQRDAIQIVVYAVCIVAVFVPPAYRTYVTAPECEARGGVLVNAPGCFAVECVVPR